MSQPKGFVTDLRLRGYAVLPAPRQARVGRASVRLDGSWAISHPPEAAGAAQFLRAGLKQDHGLELALKQPGKPAEQGKIIGLAIKPGTVKTGLSDTRDAQAYQLTIGPGGVAVIGNGPAGLLYGVATLLQLADGDGTPLALPICQIVDWPEYELRFVHWDVKHHHDRPDTLRRFLDQMVRYKLNMVSFELEDKFEYPSHREIGGPGAFTTAQLQELTAYALERHIQLVPNVQAPAHMGFVLKHEKFAHLRCDGSRYMICMDEPEARKLVFDMYDDLVKATPGVQYFHVSTDEVYYAGICEKFRRPYNPVNRSLAFVDFANAARDHLARHGRRIIIWAEFPLLTEHVKLLAPDIIDGIIGGGDEFIAQENARGIRQFAYCPVQGAELLFPSYFTPGGGEDAPAAAGRLDNVYDATTRGKAGKGKPIGSFAAAWDDAGLHNEAFWLGWAAMAQGSWTPGAATSEQTAADFFDTYYGRGVAGMHAIYRDLQLQARFFEASWDHQYSKVRGPAYGYSAAKRPVTRTDLTLLPPSLPKLGSPDLAIAPGFAQRYRKTLDQVPQRRLENDRLVAALMENLPRARRNRYNLEVLLSIARLVRHHLDMLAAVEQAEAQLVAAHAADKEGRRPAAVGLMVDAHKKVRAVVEDLPDVFGRLTAVWEKSQFPKNAPAGGREYLFVMDDVKDHFADRRVGLEYMIAPEESMELGKWCDGLADVIRQYAAQHNLAAQGLPEKVLED